MTLNAYGDPTVKTSKDDDLNKWADVIAQSDTEYKVSLLVKNQKKTDLTVNKMWLDVNGAPITPSDNTTLTAHFRLMRTTNPNLKAEDITEQNSVMVKAFTFPLKDKPSDERWTKHWTDLPAKSENNEQYYYFLVETDCTANYTFSYTVKYGNSEATSTTSGVKLNNSEANPIVMTAYNQRDYQTLRMLKQDSDGNALSGAVFSLTDSDGNSVALKTSDSNGVFLETKHLPTGTYTLTETKAPSGYSLIKGPITLEVTSAGITLKSENSKDGAVTLKKTAETGSNGKSIDIWILTAKDSLTYSLPATGSLSGTWLFTIFGTALVAGSVMLLMMRRRGII